MKDKLLSICAYSFYACGIQLFQAYGINEWVPVMFVLLLWFDSIVGVYKAYTLHGEDRNWLSMKKFITGIVTKCIMFSGILITVIVTHHVFGKDNIEFIKLYLLPMFILVMLVWILHNILQISQKKELPEIDLFSVLFSKVQSLLVSVVTEKTK